MVYNGHLITATLGESRLLEIFLIAYLECLSLKNGCMAPELAVGKQGVKLCHAIARI